MEDVKTQKNIDESLLRLANSIGEQETVLETLVMNDTAIIDALAQLLGALQQMQMRTEQTQNRLAEEIRTMGSQLIEMGSNGQQPTIVASSATSEDPEIALLEYLSSFVSDKNAIDVGANVGRLSERLLAVGCNVFAFEPYGPAFQTMQEKLKSNKNFKASEIAIGSKDGMMDFHIASDLSGKDKWDPSLFNSLVEHPMLEDCKFTKKVSVQVRTLESLRRMKEIPDNAGILKIDTEGFDLEVVRGIGEGKFSIVMTEFWDAEHPFGLSGNGNLEAMVTEMRKRGYAWHIVIYHLDEAHKISYYCNQVQTIPKSWGNVLFFQDFTVFGKAYKWCESVLAATLHR